MNYPPANTTLSLQESAKILGISTRTLLRWEDKGIITANRAENGELHFSESEVLALVNKKTTFRQLARQHESKSSFGIFIWIGLGVIGLLFGTKAISLAIPLAPEGLRILKNLTLNQTAKQIPSIPTKNISKIINPTDTPALTDVLGAADLTYTAQAIQVLQVLPSDLNRLINSSFEGGNYNAEPKGWDYLGFSTNQNTKVSPDSIRTGTVALKFNDPAASRGSPIPLGISQSASTTINGRDYVLSGYLRCIGTCGNPTLRLGFIGGRQPGEQYGQSDKYQDFSLSGVSDWKSFSLTYKNAALGKYPLIQILNYQGGSIHLDDLSLYEISQLGKTNESLYQNITRIGDGSIVIDASGNFYPTYKSNGSAYYGGQIGLTDHRFSKIYANDGDFSGGVSVGGTLTANNFSLSGGDLIVSNGNIDPGFNVGSVVFQGSDGLAQNNSNFFWDNSNYRLGIGTSSPTTTLDITGTANVSGNTTLNSNVTLGDATTDSITFTGRQASHLLPITASTYNLGSALIPYANVYADNIVATATDISGTKQETFTIDSDNTGGNLAIVFGQTNNEQLIWNATSTRFNFTDDLLIDNTLEVTGNTTLTGDLAINGDDITSDGALTINATTYTRIGDSGTPGTANGDDDLYVEGDLEVDGTVTFDTATFNCTDCIDFDDLEDTLDLDAALTLNQTTNTWSQTFTGTTTTGLSYAANSLTTGTAVQLSSTSTAGGASGSSKVLDISRSGTNSNATHTAYGIYSAVTNTGTTSTNVGGYFSASGASNNYGLIVENGNVGIGTATPGTTLTVAGTLRVGLSSDSANYNLDIVPRVVGGGNVAYDFNVANSGMSAVTNMTFASPTSGSTIWKVGIGDTSPDAFLEVLGTSEQLRLTYTDGTIDSRFSVSSTGDLTIDSLGGGTIEQLILADADVLNIGGSGSTDVAYNVIGDSTSGAANVDSDDDLYIEGNLEVDGTIYGTVSATDLTCTDCLDFAEFEDTLDLDAALTLNQTTNTWSQTFTGDTTTGLTYTASSLTSGTANLITTASTAFTGKLVDITSTGGNAANTGTLLHVQSAALDAETTAMITNLGTGISFRVNDATGDADTTPFIIDASGQVGIGTATPTAPLHVIGNAIVSQTLSSTNLTIDTFQAIVLDTTNALWKNYGGAHILLDSNANATTDYFSIRNNSTTVAASSELFRIQEDGNVGIGSTAPDARLEINHATGDNLRLTYNDADGSATAYTDFSLGSAGDLTLDSAGGDIIFADADVLNIGGSGDDVAFNAIGDDTAGAASVDSDDDLYIEGDLEVDGTIYGTVSATDLTCTDCLDFTDFEDTLDLDAALTLNQTTNTWSQTFTGTTTTGLSYAANSLTTGTAVQLSSTSTAGGASGSSKVLDVSRSGTNSNATHTAYGMYSAVTNTGTTSTNVGGYFSASGASNNYGLIVENGNVGVGTTTPDTPLEVSATGNGSVVIPLSITNAGSGIGSGVALDFKFTGSGTTYGQIQNLVPDAGGGDLVFSVRNTLGTVLTERMRLNSLGYVGIGTNAPAVKLDVTGSVASGTISTEDEFHISRLTNPTVSWPQVAAFKLGSYTENSSSNGYGPSTRLDIDLKAAANGTLTGDTNVMTLLSSGNVGIAATAPDARLEINHATGDNLRLTYNDADGSAAAYTDFSLNSGGDLTIDSAGGQLYLADTDVFNIGGLTAVAYNTLANSGEAPEEAAIAADNDLYIGGDLEVDGTIYGTVSATDVICTDCLDFTDFEDTLDLDAALTLNQTTNTWSQTFTGDTTTGLSYAANSLTTGTAVQLSSTSTAGGGSGSSKLLDLSRSGTNSNASHTAYGIYSAVTNTGTTSTNVAGYLSASGATNNYGLIVANGNVGIANTAPETLLHVTANSTGAIRITGNAGTSNPSLEWKTQDGVMTRMGYNEVNTGLGIGFAATFGGLGTNAIFFEHTLDADIIVARSGAYGYGTSSIVGIGFDPGVNTAGRLQVRGATDLTNILLLENNAGTDFFTVSNAGATDWLIPAAGDVAIDAGTTANTTTSGVFDLNVNSITANNVGLNVDYTVNDGTTAANDLFAGKITLTQNDADADLFGLQITAAATTNAGAGSYECLLCLTNAENTSGTLLDAIRIGSTAATAGSISTGLDFDTTDITTDIELQNDETIDNNVDGTILLTATTSQVSGNFKLPTTTSTTGAIYDGTALFIHQYGTDNFFAGHNAGNLTSTGTGQNIGIGRDVMASITTASDSVAIGYNALDSATSAYQNVAIGSLTLSTVTTGVGNAGSFNTAVGYAALQLTDSGNFNTAVGRSALQFNSSGSNNTAIGQAAGNTITTGSNNTFVGYDADATAIDLTNATAIGYNASVGASNSLVLGDSANVGIGTSTPLFKLDVTTTQAATVSAMITNSNTGTDADGLAIKLGFTGDGTATNRFITFLNGGGKIHGKIESNAAAGVAYQTTGIDFAEYFTKDENSNFETGDLVSLGTNGAILSSTINSLPSSLLGIVSSHPGFVGGEPGADKVLVGLVGQVPVKVASTSQSIRKGDPLTASEVTGKATKANQAGEIIGRALENWDAGSNKQTILVALNITHWQPSVTEQLTNQIIQIAQIGQIISPLAQINNLNVGTISPLADSANVVIQIGSLNNPGHLTIKNNSNDVVADIDGFGNASFSGQLTASNLDISGDSTISGTLYADRIVGQFDLATSSATYLTQNITNNIVDATSSALLAQLFNAEATTSANITITSPITFISPVKILADTTLGNTSIAGSLLVDGFTRLSSNGLESITDTLFIQKNRLADIDLGDQALVINKNGNVTMSGNLDVAGTVTIGQTLGVKEDVTAGKINIASESAQMTVSNSPNLNATIGKAILPTNTSEIVIQTTKVNANSFIYITPTTSTGNKVLFVKEKSDGTSFTVAIDGGSANEIEFNWWIIN